MKTLFDMTVLRRASLVSASVAVALVAAERAAVAPTSAKALPALAVGTLDFQARFRATSRGVECLPEAPSGAQCLTRAGTASVSGLGSVSLDYVWSFGLGPPTCPSELAKPLATTGRLVVAGKGELHFAMPPGAECVGVEPVRNQPQIFTITGGTGAFRSASGSGTAARGLGGGVGTEWWTGGLAVPGVEFDVTPPKLIGAGSKTVRAPKGAKGVRVTYEVSANDDEDGAVPVSCKPRSGSRFPVGRTVVGCSATDSSANTSNASFRVVVRPTR
jgi:HYR domain